MEKDFLIAWKNNSNGRMGRGKNLMERGEAEALATRLNEEHPEFEHVAIHKDTQNLVALFAKKTADAKVLETSLIGTSPAASSEPGEFSFPSEEGSWETPPQEREPGKGDEPDFPEAEVA